MAEAITIVVLMVMSLTVYYAVRKFTGTSLNVIGLVLLWPIVIAQVNGWSATTKWIGLVLVFIAIYLLSRRSKKVAASHNDE